jgi:hypothetical protein
MGFVTLSEVPAPCRATRGKHMNRLAAVALAAAFLTAPAVAGAQTVTLGTFVFAAVDEVALGATFSITGVLQGESAATTRSWYVSTSTSMFETCHRYALLAQAKPGQYLLEVTVSGSGYPSACRLRRAVP